MQVEGAVSVQPLAYEVEGFKEYFLHLHPSTNTRNPWFQEYWEQMFRCKYPGSAWTPYNDGYDQGCTGRERIESDNFHMEAQLQFVSDAIMAFAYALTVRYHDVFIALCRIRKHADMPSRKSKTLEMKPTVNLVFVQLQSKSERRYCQCYILR